MFIAYNPDEIIRFLLQKGIGPEKVGKVFFVQQAKEHITAPLALGDKEAVTVLDETVVVVPRQVLGGGEYIPFDEHFRPDKGLRLETGIRVLLTKKQAIVVAVVLLLFGMIWMAEGIRYGKTNTVFKKEKEVWWVCRECGYIHFGKEPPENCPSCSHSKSFYQVECEKY